RPTSRSPKKSQNFFVSIFIVLFCSLPAGLAQVLYGTMTGTVTDTSGAVVAGAQVTALEVQTGVRQSDTTDASGNYRFTTLLPGTYKVRISAQGFGAQETSDVVVRANEITRLNSSLKIGAATESVTVTGAPPTLQTDKADVH